MIPPFFSDENGDILVYKTLDGIVSASEPIDIENIEFIFWDGAGAEFSMRVVQDDDAPGGCRIQVDEKPRAGLDKNGAFARMKDFLSRTGVDPGDCGFDVVVALMARHAR